MVNCLLYTGIFMDILFLAALFEAARVDLRRREIPNLIAIIIAVLGVAATIVSASIVEHLLGLALALPLVIPGLFGHMGGGDYKLLIGTGLYLGLSQSILAVVLSIPATVCVAAYLLITKKTLKSVRIPLAPLIAFGCIGSVILKWITVYPF